MPKHLKIAIAGLGTVGSETLRLLTDQADLIFSRAGAPITVSAISARQRDKDRGIDIGKFKWFDDASLMASNSDADIIIELIGGADGVAYDTCKSALAKGRHLVTANKALVAHHGLELARIAETSKVQLCYEAAVAGGIPIVKSIREGLAANPIDQISGILNGTCNYVLTKMREDNLDFETALKNAQSLGYAEDDPSFDVDGIDSAHKLAILASLAFGTKINFKDVFIEGIRKIKKMDFEFAEELGYKIKLLGIATKTNDGIKQRVHPCLVPLEAPLSNIENVINAIEVDCKYADNIMHVGHGAGAAPTASAVVADVIDIARGHITQVFGVSNSSLVNFPSIPMNQHRGSYYMRLIVLDKSGVFAEIAAILRDHEVSMESVLQRGRNPGEPVPLVMVVHETLEANMSAAINEINQLDPIVETPFIIRIELPTT